MWSLPMGEEIGLNGKFDRKLEGNPLPSGSRPAKSRASRARIVADRAAQLFAAAAEPAAAAAVAGTGNQQVAIRRRGGRARLAGFARHSISGARVARPPDRECPVL